MSSNAKLMPCKKCLKEKVFPDEFCKGNSRKVCKECYNAIARDWRDKKRDDPEFHEMENRHARKYREANRQKINDRVNAQRRELYRTSPEYVAKTKAWKSNRDARKRGVFKFEITGHFVIALMDSQSGVCANPACRCDIRSEYHVDHIMPLARGGRHEPSNIQLLCKTCNVRKQARHPAEWLISNGVEPTEELLRGTISERKIRKRNKLSPEELAQKRSEENPHGPRVCKKCGKEKIYPEEFCKGNGHRICADCRRDYLKEFRKTYTRPSRRKVTPPVSI